VLTSAGLGTVALGVGVGMFIASDRSVAEAQSPRTTMYAKYDELWAKATERRQISIVGLAAGAGLLAAGCVVVHGNDLDDDDIARLAARGSSVVYCHGTHSHFGRPRHRIGELLDAGVNVALGTDSGLSNRGVDLWAELQRLAADRPDLDPLRLLDCATAGGRKALGLEPEAASWQPGTRADALLLAEPPPTVETWTPRAVASWALSGAAHPAATVHGGRFVLGRSTPPSLAAFLDAPWAQG